MSRFAALAGAALLVAGLSGAAKADEYLGSYVARISHHDHFVSDGYPLDTAAQMVRQDRANFHKFRLRDREDQPDRWFRSAESRARLERILRRPGAITGPVRRAILNGESLIQVDVYTRSVEVILLRR